MVRAHRLTGYARQLKGSSFVVSFYRGKPGLSGDAGALFPQGLRLESRPQPCTLPRLSHPVANPPPFHPLPPPGKSLCGPIAYQGPSFISAELAISQPWFFPLLSSQVTASHPTTREVTARAIQLHHLHLHHHLPTTTGATAPTPRPHIPHPRPQLHRPTLSPAITSISR